MKDFNLISEPWIPCLFLNERQARPVSLREAFRQAHLIREINDPSPLVTVALHRLLLAVLHRNFGPASPAAWHALWKAPTLPQAELDAYWEKWESRFNLFDTKYPFYQAGSLSEQYSVPIAKLTHELASGNNATLFDHSSEHKTTPLAPGRAAACLVAQQAFAVGGLVSLEKGQNPKLFKSARGGPLLKGAAVLIKGGTLRETMLLNLHQYDPSSEQPFPVSGTDLPWWELGKEPEAGDSIPTGYLDLLTWQSRRIRLITAAGPDGSLVVVRTVIMKGRQTPEEWSLRSREPMIGFSAIPKPKAGQDPWLPLGFRTERAIWRDSAALFQSAGESHARPKIIDWLSRLVLEGYLEQKAVLPLDLYGLCTDRAKILFWRHERLPLPLWLLGNAALVELLKESLDAAEGGYRVLQRGANRLAELALYPGFDGQQQKPDSKTARGLADSWSPGLAYWSELEVAFSHHLESIGNPSSEAERQGGELAVLQEWTALVKDTAQRSFAPLLRNAAATTRLAKAAAVAEAEFRRQLSKALPEPQPQNVEHTNG
ncbi:MAG: type I-E CRISPR-associated protein Cse1/CasA [Bryobacterales bacterium]|nr:type I-E CRISPR-associated protein Cse1/CasA [Bryobacterales bacterium]